MASITKEKLPNISDQKKRALEALERRFVVEAKLQERDHHENQKRRRTITLKSETILTASKPDRNASLASPPELNPSSSSIKGSEPMIFSCSTLQQETLKYSDGEVHPIYSNISEVIHDKLLHSCGTKVSGRWDVVSNIVNDIIQKGDEGAKFVKGGKRLKVDNWILLDNFVAKDDFLMDARLKAFSSLSKRSRKHMSMKQHRKCGSFNLPKEFHNFELFKPMHEMWKKYIVELLKETGKKKLSECLLTADLHGSFVLVVECKNTAFKGISGIMVRETAETFGIITQDNRLRVVLKVGSVFVFQAGCWKITLHGEKISERVLESNRRQKQHQKPR